MVAVMPKKGKLPNRFFRIFRISASNRGRRCAPLPMTNILNNVSVWLVSTSKMDVVWSVVGVILVGLFVLLTHMEYRLRRVERQHREMSEQENGRKNKETRKKL